MRHFWYFAKCNRGFFFMEYSNWIKESWQPYFSNTCIESNFKTHIFPENRTHNLPNVVYFSIWIYETFLNAAVAFLWKQSKPCNLIIACQMKANSNECHIAHNFMQGKHPNTQYSPFKTNGNAFYNNCSTKYAFPKPFETLHRLCCISLSTNKSVVPLKAIQSFSHCWCLSPVRQPFW